jgi:trimeric autotransporter adhesin
MKNHFIPFILLFVLAGTINSYGQYWNLAGNAGTSPSANFLGTTDAKDVLFKTNSTEVMRITNSGQKVGIGTTTPNAKLQVVAANIDFGISSSCTYTGGGTGNNFGIKTAASGSSGGANIGSYSSGASTVQSSVAYGVWGVSSNTSDPTKSYGGYFNSNGGTGIYASGSVAGNFQNGKVIIGNVTTPGSYKLYVESGILTEKVKVALKSSADWADHVFSPDYHLCSISDLKQFILENKHLPGIPSAVELVNEGGFDLAEMDAKLLGRIEELTLYIIQLKSENDDLASKLATLEEAFFASRR